MDCRRASLVRGRLESLLRNHAASPDIPPAGYRVVYDGKISWPTRGPNVNWTIGLPMRYRAVGTEKALQTTSFREARRQASWGPTRPVTPEVAGSSPVAPVPNLLQTAIFVACLGAIDRRLSDRSRAHPAPESRTRSGRVSAANRNVLWPGKGQSPRSPAKIPKRMASST